jgi:hypothetical protein
MYAEGRNVENSIKAKEAKALRVVCTFRGNNACSYLFFGFRFAELKSNASSKGNKLISAVKNQ